MKPWFTTRVVGWPDVNRVREALAERLKQLLPADIADQIALAAHELAENGIKYSTDRELELSIELDRDRVRLCAQSRPDPAELPVLLRELAALAAAPDPFVYYRDKMQASQERSDGRAALGLVRIRCEAGMTLEHELDGGVLRLRAVRELT
jgi:two-component sensor histidine kinase